MRLFFFTEEQRAAVEQHLRTVLADVDLADAVAALDMVCADACSDLSVGSAELRAVRFARRTHRREIEHDATRLRELLAADRPLWGTEGLDWAMFDAALGRTISAAHVEGEGPATRRGRPSTDWRDRLVSVTFSIYPRGKAKKAVGSHFEQTVEMLLQFVGRDIENVHGVILGALKRQPKPPFTVRLTRQFRIVR